jgi:hypothetical protein
MRTSRKKKGPASSRPCLEAFKLGVFARVFALSKSGARPAVVLRVAWRSETALAVLELDLDVSTGLYADLQLT